MIETYSRNITVAANTPIPLNNVALLKGATVEKQGTATLQFNKCGIYEVCVSASVNAETAGDITIQLQKDDVLQPNSVSTATAADTSTIYPLSFTTLVQVGHNNCPCNACAAPTNVNIINAGEPATYDAIDVVVTKIC